MALRRGADAICEKPLVLNPWNLRCLAIHRTGNRAKGLEYLATSDYIKV